MELRTRTFSWWQGTEFYSCDEAKELKLKQTSQFTANLLESYPISSLDKAVFLIINTLINTLYDSHGSSKPYFVRARSFFLNLFVQDLENSSPVFPWKRQGSIKQDSPPVRVTTATLGRQVYRYRCRGQLLCSSSAMLPFL